MKICHLLSIAFLITITSCQKPKEIAPAAAALVPSSCKLVRVSDFLYVQYNTDGTVQRATFKDSTDEVGHEEVYECFYYKGKLSAYNEIFSNTISSTTKSVSISYDGNGLISEMRYHKGLGSTSPPTDKFEIVYDNMKNITMTLKYKAEEDGFWVLSDSVVYSDFTNGRPKSVTSYRPSQKILYKNRITYDANSNLILVEKMGGEITSWRKLIEFTYSSTVKNHINLLPQAFLLGEYSTGINEGSKDIDKYAITKKLQYTNSDASGKLLPKEMVDYQEAYDYLSTNSLGYPTKIKYTDSEAEEPMVYTLQYLYQ